MYIPGFGGTFGYAPSLVLVNQYFNKRRGIATGFATSGSGVGLFVYSPLLQFLFNNYAYFGGMLIQSALAFNLCVAAMLFRPLEKVTPQDQKQCQNVTNDEQELCLTDAGDIEDQKENSSTEYMNKNEKAKNESRCCLSLEHFNKNYLDLSLLVDPIFLTFAIAQLLLTQSYMGGQMLVPPLAESRGVTKYKAVFLLSYMGIADMISRVATGTLFDIMCIRRYRVHIYNAFIFLTSLTYYAWSLSHQYVWLSVTTIMHGLLNGALVSQRAVVAADILGIERLSSSFGLTIFMQGIGVMIGPLISGMKNSLKYLFHRKHFRLIKVYQS